MITALHKLYPSLSSANINNFCDSLFLFKEFMKTNGWTVTQSGVFGSTINKSSFGDIILDSSSDGMGATIVWFVITDPYFTRQFLFLRDSRFATPSSSTGLLVAYSAISGFSNTIGCSSSQITGSNPPHSDDAVWLNNIADTTYTSPFLEIPSIIPDADSLFLPTSTTAFSFHAVLSTTAPYPFYFFFKDDITDRGLGTFIFDTLHNTGPDDTDPAAIWFCPNGINDTDKQIFTHSQKVKSWFKLTKPTNRTNFNQSISGSTYRFLQVAPLAYQTFTDTTYSDYETAFPGGLPIGPLTDDLQHLPLYYVRGNINLPLTNDYMSMPPMYKGKSYLVRLPSTKLTEFTNVFINQDIATNYLIIGSNIRIALPWDRYNLF
jgi:hypothetical protein